MQADASSLRLSGYVSFVPLDDPDNVLIVHGYSGAHDLVSPSVASYLRGLRSDDAPQTSPPSPETLARLRRRGYLTTKTVEEERDLVRRLSESAHRRELEGQPSFVIMPTYECNLRCTYCYQADIRADPARKHLLEILTPEMADRLLAGMNGLEAQRGVPPDAMRSVTFYGGEPLMRAAAPVIRRLVEGCLTVRPTNFFTVTNGVDLDAYEDLIGPEKLSGFQITLDGPPDVHDRMRFRVDKSGSFAAIAANIDLVLNRGASISLRMNVDRESVVHLPRLAEELERRGWISRPGFSVHAARITGGPRERELSSFELSQHLTRLRVSHPACTVLDRPSDQLRRRLLGVFRGESHPRAAYSASYCGAHTSMYMFDQRGDIYACWERTGDPSIRIGHVAEDGTVVLGKAHAALAGAPSSEPPKRRLPVVTAEPTDEAGWRSRHIATSPKCVDCAHAFHCGGGCAIVAIDVHQSYYGHACDAFPATFKQAAREAFADYRRGVTVARHFEPGCG